MSTLLLLTNALQASTEVLPSLALLPHQIRILPAEVAALVDAPDADAVLLDARRDLVTVRGASRLIRTTGIDVPLILVVTEGGLTAVNADWGADDVLLDTAGPAEIEARLRLVIGRLWLAARLTQTLGSISFFTASVWVLGSVRTYETFTGLPSLSTPSKVTLFVLGSHSHL